MAIHLAALGNTPNGVVAHACYKENTIVMQLLKPSVINITLIEDHHTPFGIVRPWEDLQGQVDQRSIERVKRVLETKAVSRYLAVAASIEFGE